MTSYRLMHRKLYGILPQELAYASSFEIFFSCLPCGQPSHGRHRHLRPFPPSHALLQTTASFSTEQSYALPTPAFRLQCGPFSPQDFRVIFNFSERKTIYL
jgi:hypothetical protein